MKQPIIFPLGAVLLALIIGCLPVPPSTHLAGREIPAAFDSIPFNHIQRRCSGRFVSHELDHLTSVPGGETVRMFEANGSGVAINDLDDDGDLDIVLGNHAGPNTILWNNGGLNFQTKRFGEGDARAVTVVDVDGDGRLDIFLSRRASAPNLWRSVGTHKYERTVLPGITKPLYAINWADLDNDGDLDLVGGTYDAGLLTDLGAEFLASGTAGVYVYESRNNGYVEQRMADNAQALALILPDLNEDGRPDILVGNDFAVPDYAWLNTAGGWQEYSFETTSHSTMSLHSGDINNDGTAEIFATDMMPYSSDPETMAAWQPLMDDMMDDPHPANDPQIMANTLQVKKGDALTNLSQAWNIEATGWSWSGKFGDLDQDGWLDLYVVNGFMEYDTFSHLADHELVEENQALRNSGSGRFIPAPEWGLGSTASGRGMSLGDLDFDGDLDIVVNNLRAPAQLLENQLCLGRSVQIDLVWPSSQNRRAIGATVILQTNMGKYLRTVSAASGYLSGDPARLHFGLPDNTSIAQIEVLWPDGEKSVLDDAPIDHLITIARD